MEKYLEMKDRHAEETGQFPIAFAFSRGQLDEALAKLGATADEVVTLGFGSIIRKADLPRWKAMQDRHDGELREAMGNREFAYEAFLYEMGNHEYHINWQNDWDVCSCFGRCEFAEGKGGMSYLKEMGYGRETRQAYTDAMREFYRQCDENGWW